jgi:hypothetical protein
MSSCWCRPGGVESPPDATSPPRAAPTPHTPASRARFARRRQPPSLWGLCAALPRLAPCRVCTAVFLRRRSSQPISFPRRPSAPFPPSKHSFGCPVVAALPSVLLPLPSGGAVGCRGRPHCRRLRRTQRRLWPAALRPALSPPACSARPSGQPHTDFLVVRMLYCP